MTKNFKMAVTSLSFLAVSGVITICLIKKRKKTKKIKSIEEEANKIFIKNYEFKPPNGYEFYDNDDEVFSYKNGNNMLYVNIEDFDDYDVINENGLHVLMIDSWKASGYELNYTYNEKENYKTSTYTVLYTIGQEETLGIIYNIIDPIKSKLIYFAYMINDDTKTEKEVEKEINSITDSFDEFININF